MTSGRIQCLSSFDHSSFIRHSCFVILLALPSNNPRPVIVSPMMGGRLWKIGDRIFDLSRQGLIVGILNVTPDSFSDGGKFFTAEKAVEHGLRMAAEGAHIIDVGGESTRPGAESVAAEEELNRVIPVIEKLSARIPSTPLRSAQDRLCISIDTSKAQVARGAIQAGASI